MTTKSELEKWIEGTPLPEDRDEGEAGSDYLSTIDYLGSQTAGKRESLTPAENGVLFSRWQAGERDEVGKRLFGATLNLTLSRFKGLNHFEDALGIAQRIFVEALSVWKGDFFLSLYMQMLDQKLKSLYYAERNPLSIAGGQNRKKVATEESRERYVRGRVKRVMDFRREDEKRYLQTGVRGVPVDPEHAAIEAAMRAGLPFLIAGFDEEGDAELRENVPGRDWHERQAIEDEAAERIDAKRRRAHYIPEPVSNDPRDRLVEAVARLPMEVDRFIMTEILRGYERDEDDSTIVKNLAEHLTRESGEEWTAERVRQRRKRIQDVLKSQL